MKVTYRAMPGYAPRCSPLSSVVAALVGRRAAGPLQQLTDRERECLEVVRSLVEL